ncbi:tetratricopeptide repeat protein [Myxococcota bacterium]|nr:tetratricopeptide repeat protein [Myxococcota bacterium]MBU1382506.1 tetratricopeptide repeat protein [Myxococcota bacterium]MBU1497580.1 tetratricopeptide repeat protein [Myxococcota bacterium]
MSTIEKKVITDNFNKLIEESNFTEATALLSSALSNEIDEEFRIWIYDNLGFLTYFSGNINGALDWCDKSLALKPDNSYALKGRGICLAKLGQLEDGIKSLLQSIALDPAFFDPHHDLAVILLEAGRFNEAKKWAQRAYQLDPEKGESLVRMFYQDKSEN